MRRPREKCQLMGKKSFITCTCIFFIIPYFCFIFPGANVSRHIHLNYIERRLFHSRLRVTGNCSEWFVLYCDSDTFFFFISWDFNYFCNFSRWLFHSVENGDEYYFFFLMELKFQRLVGINRIRLSRWNQKFFPLILPWPIYYYYYQLIKWSVINLLSLLIGVIHWWNRLESLETEWNHKIKVQWRCNH